MANLDLKELDRREKAMPRLQGHVWITQENVDFIGDQLRPLLYLVNRMGRALERVKEVNQFRTNGLGDSGLEREVDALIFGFNEANPPEFRHGC